MYFLRENISIIFGCQFIRLGEVKLKKFTETVSKCLTELVYGCIIVISEPLSESTLFDKGSFFVVNSLRIVAGFFGLAPKVAQPPIERCLTHAAHSKNSFK